MVDLTRPCDDCGNIIGGGYHFCPKCQFYLCFLCSMKLLDVQKKMPIECPICGANLE
jgi:hypothetical protein